MAFCVLGIQLSHFWAVDTYLTTFSAAAMLGAVRIAQGRSRRGGDALTGIALGLAVACKITALALLLPIGLAVLVRLLREGKPFAPALGRAVLRGVLILVPAALVVRIFLPYVFLGPGVLSFRLDPRWVDDLRRISQLSKSVAGFPPALQWAGRTIYFPVENFVLWGAGVFFGISAIVAAVWTVGAIVRRRAFDLAPIFFYVLFLFGYHGLTMVKSVRYFYPAYPGLAVLTGVLFSSLLHDSRAARACGAPSPSASWAGTFLWALAFTSIYRHPQTRVAATDWIYTHIPARQAIVNESWDDGLPLPKPGYDPGSYAGPPAMPLFDPDSPQKAELVVRALTEADWVAVTSNRVYANVTRVPSVFPMSIAYYRALFDGSLGFERAADFTSYPSLGPLHISDDSAEEQFTVYDHPRVLLFRKTARFSPAAARRLLLGAMPKTPPTMNDWERWPRALRQVSAPVRPDHRAAAEHAAPSVEPADAPAELPRGRRSSGTSRCSRSESPRCRSRGCCSRASQDRGFGFARLLGLVLATYAMTVGLTFRVMSNGRRAAVLCLAALAFVSAVIAIRERHDLRALPARAPPPARPERDRLCGGLPALPRPARLQPRDLLGREAHGLLDPEHPRAHALAARLGPLARRRAPRLLHVRPGDGRVPHAADQPLHAPDLQPRLRHARRNDPAGRLLARPQLGRPAARRAGRRGADAADRQPLRAARVAGAQARPRLGLLLGDLARHQGHDQRVPLLEPAFADLHAHVLAIPIFLLFAAAALHLVRLHGDPVALLARAPRAAPCCSASSAPRRR